MHPDSRQQRLATSHLYLCMPLRTDLEEFLDQVLAAGVDIVQLRDKTADDDALRAGSAIFRDRAAHHGALFILNDRPDLAREVGADGVHVGQDDLDAVRTRALVGGDLLIGRSTHAVVEVDAVQAEDCDYFAVGPVSSTPTKPGRVGIGLEPIRHAAATARRPWFVTGGMAPDTAGPVLDAGAPGLVVVRALTEAEDPVSVTRRLAELASRTAQPQ